MDSEFANHAIKRRKSNHESDSGNKHVFIGEFGIEWFDQAEAGMKIEKRNKRIVKKGLKWLERK